MLFLRSKEVELESEYSASIFCLNFSEARTEHEEREAISRGMDVRRGSFQAGVGRVSGLVCISQKKLTATFCHMHGAVALPHMYTRILKGGTYLPEILVR